MAKLFATLDPLDEPAKSVSGADIHAINIYRLTFGGLAPVLASGEPTQRVKLFVDAACKGLVNGSGSEEAIRAETLSMSDAAELVDALVEMNQAAPFLPEGDGVSHPIVYTLQHPLKLAEDMTVTQIEFSAKKLGDSARFLDASGEGDSFREFMRAFGTLIGVNLPMTDSFVNALDIEDYATIAGTVLGKLARPRGRLKKAF